MQLKNGRKPKCMEFDMNLSKDEEDGLAEYGKVNIGADRDALIEWAVNDILRKMVAEIGGDPSKLEKLLKDRLTKKTKKG